jgi:PKD repeat protein
LTGTIGSAAPGRSNATWSVSTPEGWEFIPPVDYSFSWLPTSAISGQTDLSTAVAQPSATQQYQLVVTDNNTGCENSLNNQSYVTVSIASAVPNASFVANDLTVSTGGVLQVVNFTNNTPQLGGETWVWTFNPTTVQFAGGTNANSYQPQVQFLSPGDYTVTLSVTSCTGTDDLVRTNYITAIPEYCFPSFGTGSGFDGCDDGDAVGNVVITSPASVNVMQHLNTGCTTAPNAYIEYAPVAGVTSATLYQGTTYSMQVTSVSPTYSEFFAAYLDVNDDGDFSDPLEFLGGNASAATSATFDIGIPTSNVTYGLHRLRVIAAFGTGALDANDACIVTSYGEAHDYFVNIQPPVVLNDIPAFATNVAYSTNLNYPTCYPITGNTALATNSPESAGTTGNDLWFRFTAQSTGVSISLTSATMDDYIGLYSRDLAGNYNLVASENVGTGAGDFERLNVGGLTAGSQYWISVGSAAAGAGGAFSLCIQNLMPSSCAYAIPAGGFRLCDAFKAIYRGAPSQGVTYNFTFTPVAPTAGVATSLTGTNGLITLSNATLALRYGGVYNAKVDVLYTLNNSASTPEPILVQGNPAAPTCSNVPIQAHPLMEVRSTQRCPATLLRSNYLVGTTVSGSTSSAVCGALNYTYEFTQVTSCADGTVISVAPATYTTGFATPYLGLGVLGNLPNAGAWDVRIRPNFSYGPGTYGPVQRINVNNTSASSMLNEDAAEMDVKVESFVAANLYPNPNNGEMVNLNVSGIESDNVFVRITDAMGRVVYTNRFAVEGSLNTIVTFSEALSSGIYNVEFTVDGQIMTERMIVAKQ